LNPTPWIAAALLSPLAAAQKAAPEVAAPATADFETLSALEAASPAGARHALDLSMATLAEDGDGRALAWCLRHPEAFGDERAARTLDGFARLVREHAGAAWLERPELDPAAALRRLDRATRQAVAQALAGETFADPAGRALALWLEANALAPSEARDAVLAAAARERLGALRALDPEGPWARRADELAWRLEHLVPGAAAPALELRDVDGNQLVLADWLDGDVLVDVWRADDPDRVARAAELAALVERVKAQRPERRLRVLALGLGGDEAGFRRELEELELPWPTGFEACAGGPARRAWRLDGRPTRLWIDASGALRAVDGSTGELEARLLAPPEPAGGERAEPIRGAPSEVTPEAAVPDARRET